MSKIFLSSIFLLIILLPISLCKLNPQKVIVAINCGGNEYEDSKGVTYIEDKYFNRGTASDHGLSYEIKGTEDESLYQTERWASSTLTYSIPLTGEFIDGKYVLVLKFSEVYFNEEGAKVFDVALGKEKVIKNLDVYSRVGKAHALDEYVEFEIKDEKVYYNKKVAKGALESGDKLQINFLKGKSDNPKINAILLVKGSLSDTDYYESQKKTAETKKKRLNEAKKKYTIDLRHDSDELFDESVLLDEDFDADSVKKSTGLFSIYNSYLGKCIGGSLVLFGILNYLIDFF